MSQVVLKLRIFEYFYGSNQGPLDAAHLGPLDLHLKNLVKDH